MKLSKNSKFQALALVTLAVSLTGLMSGCSKMGAHHQMGQSQVREQTTYKKNGVGNPQGADKTNVAAEQAIQTIAASSANVYDSIKASQWQQASDELSKVKQANSELKGSKLGKGSDQYVDRISSDLTKQINQKDRVQALESANQLTRASMDLGEPVPATVPKEVSLLGYYGRELEIGTMAKDKNKLSGTAKDIEHTWNSLKPKIEQQSKGKGGESNQFDSLVKQLGKANSTQDYQRLSGQILDHVDKMEGMYGKS